MKNYLRQSDVYTAVLLMLLFVTTGFAQSSAGSITGTIKDASGAVIPGATVSVTNPATSTTQSATSSDDGVFVFAQLPPATYTIVVEQAGFKRAEKTSVVLSTGDRLNAGEFVLETGGVTETVTVQADAGQLQVKTESGERSDLVTNTQIKDLAINGRNILELTKIVPGVINTVNGQINTSSGLSNIFINGTRGNQHDLTIDGSSNVITGGNGNQQVTVNPDAISEVKILTSNFQAEYAKSSGGVIQYTTRSGTNQFRGTARYFRRHDSLNANTTFNNAQGLPRGLYRYDYYGYDIGGPIVLPRFGEGGPRLFNGKDKLFFFFSQEYYQQLIPNAARNISVPTVAERNGDFSSTTDGNGNRIFLRDPTKTGTCSVANTAANPGTCFVYQGRINVIDPALFFRDGQNILNIYPLPNSVEGGARYNYTSQISDEFPRREDILRIDYNINSSTRLSGRVINNPDERPFTYSPNNAINFPLSPFLQTRNPVNASFTLVNTLSPTVTNEFIFGPSRYNFLFSPSDNKVTRAGNGISFPLLFPDANTTDLLPTFTFGGIANQTFPTNGELPLLFFEQLNKTYNFIDNLTKVAGQHTLKAGIFVQYVTFKNPRNVPYNSNITFNTDANNPLNAGHPYANALLGNYTNYSQRNVAFDTTYTYTNTEFYVQDTWKVTQRLTLDYGMRFSIIPPQYEANLLNNNFDPELYDPTRAVRLYAPVLVGTQRRAVDPANQPATLTAANTLPGNLVGLIVPGSGDTLNGIGQARNGYFKGGFKSRGVQLGPRFGFAYNVLGDGNTVVRGGFGIAYDRVQSNTLTGLSGNPPNSVQPSLLFGRLADLPTSSASGQAPSSLLGFANDGKIPNVYSYSLGLQRNIGFSTVLDVAYVGTLSRHLQQQRNINAVPYLATFQRANQDSSRYAGGIVPIEEANLPAVYRQAGLSFTGANALPADFLRPYLGFGAITFREFVGSSNYNSLQVGINRRFSRGLTFGVAYTFSKALGTADADDGSTNPFNTRAYDYKVLSFDRPHTLVVNYVYDLPKVSAYLGGLGENKLVRALADNFQVSGISQYYSGTPFEIDFGINGVNAGQRFTGSYDVGPVLQLRGDPQFSGRGTDESQLDPTAFVIPRPGDISPASRRYLRTRSQLMHNVSLFKNFPISGEGSRYLQLRLEAFNIFNTPIYGSINSGATLVVPSTNANDASGFTNNAAAVFNNFENARITDNLRGLRQSDANVRSGQFFGEYNGAQSPRIIQLGVKLYF